MNIYDYEVPAERVKQISELTGKPIVIGEFHFGAPGRGLAASLVLVRDQAERGRAYRYYVEQAFAQPELIGTHYFQWADQPVTGRFDGENYNIGLVDVTDRPYPHMVEALQETHGRLHGVHAGEEEPFAEKARVNYDTASRLGVDRLDGRSSTRTWYRRTRGAGRACAPTSRKRSIRPTRSA